jgi:hypothetical protein
MFPPDIEHSVFSTLNAMFTETLQNKVAGDFLALRTLKKAPLQDDPTLTAPYLVYQKDPEMGIRMMSGEEQKIYGAAEIGGPQRYLLYMDATCGTPLTSNREEADNNINNLASRVMNVLAEYFDLSGFTRDALMSPDMSRIIEGANPWTMFYKECRTRIYGGESTWYGEARIYWRYPISWYVQSVFV